MIYNKTNKNNKNNKNNNKIIRKQDKMNNMRQINLNLKD